MATGKHRLTARKVETVKKCGYLSDGAGLYLKVRASGAKSWAYIWTGNGIRTEKSLGSATGATALSLKLARVKAETIRDQLAQGIDPFQERVVIPTFLETAQEYFDKLSPGWKSAKTREQWKRSLFVDCKSLHALPVDKIKDADCRKVVMPVWERTNETALRLRKRLERVLSYAESHGWRESPNPARWAGHFKEQMIGADKVETKHFPALPYSEIPNFLVQLHEIESVTALALEYLILTACRTGEVLGALWQEIDIEHALWVIPATRMKNGNEHTVPLTARCLEIIEAMRPLRRVYATSKNDYIFPGQRPGRPLSNMSLVMLMRRMGYGDYVPHGYRAAFRTWCGNETNTPREVAEAALSHQVGSAVELAYSRGDMLEKRRRLMPLWADYCAGKQIGEIVRLHG